MRPPIVLPDNQWDLPISVDLNDDLVTLRQAVHRGIDSIPGFDSLTIDQKARVTLMRIISQPMIEIVLSGEGKIDRQRAIREVVQFTRLGRNLIDVERQLIAYAVKEVMAHTNADSQTEPAASQD